MRRTRNSQASTKNQPKKKLPRLTKKAKTAQLNASEDVEEKIIGTNAGENQTQNQATQAQVDPEPVLPSTSKNVAVTEDPVSIEDKERSNTSAQFIPEKPGKV